jgi:hypothetical protein
VTAALLLTGVAGTSVAGAQDVAPIDAFGPGTAAEARARDIARATWGGEPCGGQVTISWMDRSPSINASAIWGYAVDLYADPELNVQCQIRFNPAARFDWSKFCTVMVHEYGHLSGHAHSEDPHDLMYAYYEGPIPACVDAPVKPAVAVSSSTRKRPARNAHRRH